MNARTQLVLRMKLADIVASTTHRCIRRRRSKEARPDVRIKTENVTELPASGGSGIRLSEHASGKLHNRLEDPPEMVACTTTKVRR